MRHVFRLALGRHVAAVVCVVTACAPSSLVEVHAAPNTVIDPSQVATASAAIQLYNSAIGYMTYPLAVDNYGGVVPLGGELTDELQSTNQRSYDEIDTRNVFANPGNAGGLYRAIHNARVQQLQARQALQQYAPTAPSAWQGQLYANEGYTVLFFAEYFCSGIPLATVPLVGPQTPTRGFTTQELYARALGLFDSALAAGMDSAQFVNLALVGKARALLGLGQFAAADSAAQSVPTTFVYNVQFSPPGLFTNYLTNAVGRYRAQDNEGTNGLLWSTDPRTGIMVIPSRAGAMLWPAKYFVTSAGTLDPTVTKVGSVRLADGLEARLIQAESELAVGNANWLAILNSLRATCVGTSPCAPVPGLTVAALPPLADPGVANGRLDLVMKERAMWLYLTGHREGDLRRLARVYQRDPHTLWPIGIVSAPAFPPLYSSPLAENGSFYGSDVVLPPDPSEVQRNPLYGGCYDQDP